MLNEYSDCEIIREGIGHNIMDDKKLFLESLTEIIEERKQEGKSFYNVENNEMMLAEEYYENIFSEIKRLSGKIFADSDFMREQFSHYDDFRNYINDIINDIVKEESISSLPLSYIS